MSLTSRLRALERHAPGESNPWRGAGFWRVEPGEDLATNEKTGERLAVDDVPAYHVLVVLPRVTNEPE